MQEPQKNDFRFQKAVEPYRASAPVAWEAVMVIAYIAILLLTVAGCNPCVCEPTEAVKARAAELSSGYTKQTDKILTKQDETLTALAAIKSQVENLASETREAIDTLKAPLVKSEPKPGTEVIKSALDPQEPTRPDPSQPLKPVASAPAVRSSTVKISWNVEGNWNPTILETAKHLREDHGIIADGMTHQQMHDAHAAAHEGRPVAMRQQPVQFMNRGTQCPGGVCPTPRNMRVRWRR